MFLSNGKSFLVLWALCLSACAVAATPNVPDKQVTKYTRYGSEIILTKKSTGNFVQWTDIYDHTYIGEYSANEYTDTEMLKMITIVGLQDRSIDGFLLTNKSGKPDYVYQNQVCHDYIEAFQKPTRFDYPSDFEKQRKTALENTELLCAVVKVAQIKDKRARLKEASKITNVCKGNLFKRGFEDWASCVFSENELIEEDIVEKGDIAFKTKILRNVKFVERQ